jgi:hypothetical protein
MSESSSETAYERGRRHGETGTGPGSGGGGNGFLTRMVGPLPLWVWGAMGLILAVTYYVYSKNKTSKSVSATAANQTNTSTGTTNSSLIPQFVNQVYTNPSPPPGHNHRGGTEKPPPTGVTGGGGTIPATSVIVAVPNGSGGWMAVTFPSQSALDTFYKNIGVTNGAYPNGLNNQQLTSAVTAAGGAVASADYNQDSVGPRVGSGTVI